MSTSQSTVLPEQTREAVYALVEAMIEDAVTQTVLETPDSDVEVVRETDSDVLIEESVRTPTPGENQGRVRLLIDDEFVSVTIELQKWDLPSVTNGEEPFVPGQTTLSDHGDAFTRFGEVVVEAMVNELVLNRDAVSEAVVGNDDLAFTCDGVIGPGFSPTTLVRYVCIFDVAAFDALNPVVSDDG